MDLYDVTFLFDNQLIAGLEKLIKNSSKTLFLISPFIDLDNRIKDALREKINDPEFELKVLFGKNESKYLRSITPDTLSFLKKFPNIEIRHNQRLHAKFFMNECTFLMTSLNLYNFSLANNIEVGLIVDYAAKGMVGRLIESAGAVVLDNADKLRKNLFGLNNDEEHPVLKFYRIFESSEIIYKTIPTFKEQGGLIGLLASKKINGFEVVEDKFLNNDPKKSIGYRQEYKVHDKDVPRIVNQEKAVNQAGFSNTSTKKLSANQLSKSIGKSPSEIIEIMQKKGLINGNTITEIGKQKGLETRIYMGNSYIVFPENLPEIRDLKK